MKKNKEKKYINKIYIILIIFILLMNVFSNTLIVLATADIAAGQYGNITWVIDSVGKLTVSGSGDYFSPYTKGAPWYQYRAQITSADVNMTTGSTDLSYMFYGCSNLVQVTFGSTFDTSLITNMEGMFYGCSSLRNLDISKFNTSKVTDMSFMFAGCKILASLNITTFDTSKVVNMSNMFDSCQTLPSLNLSNFNTALVTNMRGMFNECSNLTTLNISTFNTSNVTDMSYMFEGCSKITSLNISTFNTSKVTNMYSMFSGCSGLTSLNIAGMNTQNVIDMGYMFEGCRSITNIDTSILNTAKVTSMYSMFSGCISLTELKIAGFNTSKVTDLSYFAYNCISLSQIDMSAFDSGLVGKASNTLGNDKNLTVIKSLKNLKVASSLPVISGKTWIDQNSPAQKYTDLPLNNTNSITLVLEAKSYTIKLNENGGTINSGNISSYLFGSAVTLPSNVTKNGYTFAGWYDNSTFTGNAITNITVVDEGNKEYYAKWTPTNYTITYNLDGGNVAGNVASYTIETESFTLKEPTKDGYVFSGWTGSNGTTPNKNITVAKGSTGNLNYTANWEAISYNVTLYTNGGTINSGNVTSYLFGVGATLPTDITKTGFTFVGWFENSDLTGNIVYNISTTDIGNKTYYAKWANSTFNIKYNLNSGNINGSYPTTYSLGTGANLPTDVTKEGYSFAGWYIDSSFTGNAVSRILGTESGDREYFAKWDVIGYTITYNLNGGKVTTNPTTYNSESENITLNNPTKEGYTFLGWTGSNGTTEQSNVTISKGSSGNKEYTANWKPITYTVKFNSNNGTGTMSDQIFTYDQGQSLQLNTFTRDGWDFGGWGTSTTNPIYSDGENVKNLSNIDGSTVTLYAIWKVPPVFYITYNLDGGTSTNPVSYNQFDLPISLNPPTKEGYTFLGWTGSNGTTEETIVTIPVGTEGPLEYTAHWKQNTYTIKYNANGGTGSMNDTICTYDIQTNLLKNTFTYSGYKFKGWSTSSTGSTIAFQDESVILNETKNDGEIINLYAVWEEEAFKISFIWSDGLDSISPVAYHTKYKSAQLPMTLDNPTRTGYTFLGWVINLGETPQMDYVIPTGTIGDLTYIAIWQPDTFNISYDLKGGAGTFNNQTKDYAKSLNIYNTEPTMGGYAFLGWDVSEEANTVVYKPGDGFNRDQNTTLYAVWKQDNFTVTFMDLGNIARVQNVIKGGTAVAPNISKVGYRLMWDKDLTNIQADTIITAIWMPNTYTIRYNSNGGIGSMTDSTFVYGASQKLRKSTFTKTGNTFLGWSESATNNTVIYSDEQLLLNETSNNGEVINLYAVWYEDLYLKSNVYRIGDTNTTTYENNEQYIYRISPDTKLLDFKNNISTNGTIAVYSGTNSIDDTTYVGTGMTLKVTKDNKTISIMLIVTGDIDGNGKDSITDLSMLNQHLIGKIELVNERLKAADLDYNGKISLTDLSRLNQFLIGLIKTL